MKIARNLFFLLTLLLVIGVGCVSQAPDLSEEVLEVSDFQIIDEIDEPEEADKVESEPGDSEASGEEDAPLELSVATFAIRSGNYFFEPENLMVESGQEVIITFSENDGTHTFVIDEIGFKTSISAGDTVSFTAPEEPGRYYYYCDIGPHRDLGMEGILVVE